MTETKPASKPKASPKPDVGKAEAAYRDAIAGCAAAWKGHAAKETARADNAKKRHALIEQIRARFDAMPEEERSQDPDFLDLRRQVHELNHLLQHRSKHSLGEYGAACQARRELLEAMGKPITAAERDQVHADIDAAVKE